MLVLLIGECTGEQAMSKFEAKIRFRGSVSYVTVTAHDSARARQLIQAQYGDDVTILQIKRIG